EWLGPDLAETTVGKLVGRIGRDDWNAALETRTHLPAWMVVAIQKGLPASALVRPKPVANLVAPTACFCRVHHKIVTLEIEEAVALRGDPPFTVQPPRATGRAVPESGLTPSGPFVIVAHFFGADTPDLEVFVQVRVLHDVDVANLLVAAHLAGRVIGFVGRLPIGPQVDNIHAVPAFMRYARLVPAATTHS